MLLDYVIWNLDPKIFSIGPLSIRYYGLFFTIAFIVGYRIMAKIYKKENLPDKELDRLSIYMFVSLLLGARLGHVLFYQPDYYFSHPWDIIKVWEGGLASHGATIGILIGLYLYTRKKGAPTYMWILDRIVLAIPIGGALVRFGNLMNSEIYGIPTKLPWGFVYLRDLDPAKILLVPQDWWTHTVKIVNTLPPGIEAHHPTQIYEGIAYLLIFFLMWAVYKHDKGVVKPGRLLGLFLILLFTLRFFVEFIKEVQVDFEKGLTFNMGQQLSIPFIIVGIFILIRSFRIQPGEEI